MKISYVIGTNSYTKEVNLTSNESLEIMNKQLSLSIPLITGAKIKRKKRVKQIFVGKELSLSSLHKNNFWLQKYDLSLEEVMDIALQGYKRACLLNYKKYDQILVGVHDEDITVPDYFSLKKLVLNEMQNA